MHKRECERCLERVAQTHRSRQRGQKVIESERQRQIQTLRD